MRTVPRMSRISGTVRALVFGSLGLASALAQESAELRELRELRTLIEKQSKQIDSLNQQVSRLHEALDLQKPTPPASASVPLETVTEIPKAEAVEQTPRHVVAKGETLTSIAKQYNIPLAELQKVNKIENDRKLQIGQTLKVPIAKPAETPAPEKTP